MCIVYNEHITYCFQRAIPKVSNASSHRHSYLYGYNCDSIKSNSNGEFLLSTTHWLLLWTYTKQMRYPGCPEIENIMKWYSWCSNTGQFQEYTVLKAQKNLLNGLQKQILQLDAYVRNTKKVKEFEQEIRQITGMNSVVLDKDFRSLVRGVLITVLQNKVMRHHSSTTIKPKLTRPAPVRFHYS